jgi:hypothetical protein
MLPPRNIRFWNHSDISLMVETDVILPVSLASEARKLASAQYDMIIDCKAQYIYPMPPNANWACDSASYPQKCILVCPSGSYAAFQAFVSCTSQKCTGPCQALFTTVISNNIGSCHRDEITSPDGCGTCKFMLDAGAGCCGNVNSAYLIQVESTTTKWTCPDIGSTLGVYTQTSRTCPDQCPPALSLQPELPPACRACAAPVIIGSVAIPDAVGLSGYPSAYKFVCDAGWYGSASAVSICNATSGEYNPAPSSTCQRCVLPTLTGGQVAVVSTAGPGSAPSTLALS